jgi:hypothetical protein
MMYFAASWVNVANNAIGAVLLLGIIWIMFHD